MNDIILEAKDLCKNYRTGNEDIEVLANIDLSIQSGEFLTITGASGVGKTTLLYILGLLDEPTKGRIFFNGIDTKSLNERKRSKLRNDSIGFVFQFYNLLPEFTALENVLLPSLMQKNGLSSSEKRQRAQSLLNNIGLSHRLNHKPSQLSGGEQQRVAISRALMNKPDLILADEPTGNLDAKAGFEIMELLKELNEDHKQTIVVVTHNEELAQIGTRCIHMLDKKLLK
ncbi:ABC transporter ATP-binding protein [bacterium]|nr:ABC transporter ATP-binding protein [bacterium]